MENKFRASWTVLSTWASGDYEKAIKYYFHMDTFKSKQMEDGAKFHKMWEEETSRTKCLPAVFGGKRLIDPVCEGKIVVQLEPWLELVFISDCRDGKTLFEYKTGKSGNSESYANAKQTGIYSVGHLYNKTLVEKIEIHHYDQYRKKSDMSIKWVTDTLLQESLEWIITNASEMHEYLTKNKLYEQFKN